MTRNSDFLVMSLKLQTHHPNMYKYQRILARDPTVKKHQKKEKKHPYLFVKVMVFIACQDGFKRQLNMFFQRLSVYYNLMNSKNMRCIRISVVNQRLMR